jgi:hypothetical protein
MKDTADSKRDEKGRIILRVETVRVNTDIAGYTQLPFIISPKSRKDITFRFDKATKLTTLFGFPPLPEVNFLIWHDDTTSIPKLYSKEAQVNLNVSIKEILEETTQQREAATDAQLPDTCTGLLLGVVTPIPNCQLVFNPHMNN